MLLRDSGSGGHADTIDIIFVTMRPSITGLQEAADEYKVAGAGDRAQKLLEVSIWCDWLSDLIVCCRRFLFVECSWLR